MTYTRHIKPIYFPDGGSTVGVIWTIPFKLSLMGQCVAEGNVEVQRLWICLN